MVRGMCLFDTGFDLVDSFQVAWIGLDQLFDSPAGGDDRRMVFLAEFIADLLIRRIQEFPAEIHRDVSRIGDVFGPVLGDDLLLGEVVVVADSFADRDDAQFILIFFYLILKGFYGQFQSDVIIGREVDRIEQQSVYSAL